MEDLQVLLEFQEEGEGTEEEVQAQYDQTVKALEDLEFKSTLNNDEDQPGCHPHYQQWGRWHGELRLGGDARAYVPCGGRRMAIKYASWIARQVMWRGSNR